MRILVEMRHPAHFHHFKHFVWQMQNRGHQVKVIASSKDILLNLLEGASMVYVLIGENRKGLRNKAMEQSRQTRQVTRICRTYDPDLLVGRPSPSITIAGWLLRKNRIIFAEDDLRAVWLAGFMAYPFVTDVLSPTVTDLGAFSYKKIGYFGNQKLAYLHPSYFQPDATKVRNLFDSGRPYYILRLSSFDAHHDKGVGGITPDMVRRLISILSMKGNVYISSEGKLSSEFQQYQININPLDVHHALYFADLFIGDSQSMTVEAAMLGTPSIRFNDFVGRLNVLEVLENTYELTYGFRTDETERLFSKLSELLEMQDMKEEWRGRRERMLSDQIDVTAFMVWFAENYPESARQMRDNPNYQLRFQ